MENNKNNKKRTFDKKSKPHRIPISFYNKLRKAGDGNINHGIAKVLTIYEHATEHPEQLLMRDVETLMSDLQHYYGDNHYTHFDNFPSIFRMFLHKGHVDFSLLNRNNEEDKHKEN